MLWFVILYSNVGIFAKEMTRGRHDPFVGINIIHFPFMAAAETSNLANWFVWSFTNALLALTIAKWFCFFFLHIFVVIQTPHQIISTLGWHLIDHFSYILFHEIINNISFWMKKERERENKHFIEFNWQTIFCWRVIKIIAMTHSLCIWLMEVKCYWYI